MTKFSRIFKKKAIFAVVVALMAVSIVPFTGKGNASAAAELRWTSSESREYKPALSSKYLAWVDERNGSPELYAYHFGTQTEKRLTRVPSHIHGPVLAGDRIVWAEDTGVVTTLKTVYIPSGETQVLTETGLRMIGMTANDSIVFYTLSEPNGLTDVYEFRLDNATGRRLTNDDKYQSAPSSDGPVVVWSEYTMKCETTCVKVAWSTAVVVAQPAGDIYNRVREYREDVGAPKVSGHTIVWTEARGGKQVIVRYNFVTNQEYQVSESTRDAKNPTVTGDLIAYLTARNDSYDAVTYNTRTEEYFNVTWDTATQKHLTAGENRLAWTDDRLGSEDIFIYDLKADGSTIDQDNDGVADATEWKHGSNRYGDDTDNDGLSDKDEILVYHTKPTDYDTDSDGFSDGEEVKFQGTNPVLFDTDGDGYGDKTEVVNGYSPLVHARFYSPYKSLRLPESVEGTGATALYEALNRILGEGRYTVSDEDWHTYLMASIYGHYTPREIARAIAGAPTVHPTILADAWRNSDTYLAYVKYGKKTPIFTAAGE